jgi:hypothetical protein
MRLMRFTATLLLAALCLCGGYIQRETAEDLLRRTRNWTLLRTSESQVKQDLARYRSNQIGTRCAQNQCTFSYDFSVVPQHTHKELNAVGVRWSRLGLEVNFRNGVLSEVFFVAGWELLHEQFNIFEITRTESPNTPGEKIWAGRPHVTAPIPGDALIQHYSSGISKEEWQEVFRSINTECISRWHPCDTLEEAMPQTWRQYQRQQQEMK